MVPVDLQCVISEISSAKVRGAKTISGTFSHRSGMQINMAVFDFLLVFCGDIRFRWNCCRVVSRCEHLSMTGRPSPCTQLGLKAFPLQLGSKPGLEEADDILGGWA